MLKVEKKYIAKILENSLKLDTDSEFTSEDLALYAEEIAKAESPVFLKNKYTGEIFILFTTYPEDEEITIAQLEFKRYVDIFEEEKIIMHANICDEKLFIGTFENLVPFFSFIETVETVENIKEPFATYMYFFEGEIQIDWNLYEKVFETPQKKLEVYKNRLYTKYIVVINDEEGKIYLEGVMIDSKFTVFWDYTGVSNQTIEVGEISNLTDEMVSKFMGFIDEIEEVETDTNPEQSMV